MSAGRAAAALLAGLLLCQCSSTSDEVYVSVKEQRMGVYSEGRLVKQYVISTSKFGVGDEPGTYRTPLGKHEIVAKIGHGLPTGAVLKSRSWNGEVLKPNAPGRDPIVSRILWLRGMESRNRNAYKRFIYIHGTTEENRLGTPASYGCIRMGMKDVVELFNDLPIGSKVVVTTDNLPRGSKAKETPPEGAAPAEDAGAGDDEPLDITDQASPNPDAPVKAVPIPVSSPSGENLPETPAAAPEENPKTKKRGMWPFRKAAPDPDAPPADERTVDEDKDATPRAT